MIQHHAPIRNMLYEYLRDELDEHDRLAVEKHLQRCRRCCEAADDLGLVLGILTRPASPPAEECPPEFWQNLISDVEGDMRPITSKRRSLLQNILEEVAALPVFQPKVAIALGVLLVVIATGIVTWELTRSGANDHQTAEAPSVAPPARNDSTTIDVDTRVHDYLRRSKVLLVGLANLKTGAGSPLDLSTERRASRELAHEARYLTQQPLDERSARLINDLKKIQIELSNSDDQKAMPDVDLIRQGIQRKNLLFKVRVAETLYDRANVMRTHYER